MATGVDTGARDEAIARRRLAGVLLEDVAREVGLSVARVSAICVKEIPDVQRREIDGRGHCKTRTAPRVTVICEGCGGRIDDVTQAEAKRGRRFHRECQPLWRLSKPESEVQRVERARAAVAKSRAQREAELAAEGRLFNRQAAERVGIARGTFAYHVRMGRVVRDADGLVPEAETAKLAEYFRATIAAREQGAVTRREAAELLGSTMRLVHRARRDGLRTITLHGRRFYFVEDIERAKRRIREEARSGDHRSLQAFDVDFIVARDRAAVARRLRVDADTAEAIVRRRARGLRRLLLGGAPRKSELKAEWSRLFYELRSTLTGWSDFEVCKSVADAHLRTCTDPKVWAKYPCTPDGGLRPEDERKAAQRIWAAIS